MIEARDNTENTISIYGTQKSKISAAMLYMHNCFGYSNFYSGCKQYTTNLNRIFLVIDSKKHITHSWNKHCKFFKLKNKILDKYF